ncbi:hypothetical protein ACFYW9_38490 [Streptomyces sp. NPDC002698]|uniref:hypothetical protein n=1 Tax=Streptomyces sp. NPDC002698 TaxID=3364660 RepID=UPI003677685C
MLLVGLPADRLGQGPQTLRQNPVEGEGLGAGRRRHGVYAGGLDALLRTVVAA